MSEKVKFEIQIEAPKTQHGWKAIGGRDSYFYLSENNRVKVVTDTVAEARESVKRINAYFKRDWFKPAELRIVKITVVTTYDVVE